MDKVLLPAADSQACKVVVPAQMRIHTLVE